LRESLGEVSNYSDRRGPKISLTTLEGTEQGMQLQFLGAAQMVTGSCYLLETNGQKVLIDCGLYQGSSHIKERNYQDFPFNPQEIVHCLLTHAHTDHTGLIPKLYKDGYSGPVTATKATVELCEIMLPDSGHIQEMEVERKNRKRARANLPPLNPIYTSLEAAECIRHFRGVEYKQLVEIFPGLEVRFQDAGHILGSSMIEVWVTEGEKKYKLIFSGDIGNTHQPFINDPSCLQDADFVVMESTYGNRLHGTGVDKLEILKQVVNDTYERGGNLIIPAFAIERTQDILYYLNQLTESGQIPPMDIYVDSPLAIAATRIFRNSFTYFDDETKALIKNGEDPLNMPRLHFSQSADESRALNEIKGRSIIIAASGMADAGRIKHHLRHNLWRTECTVLFVGYQAEGTLGRRLVNGEGRVLIHGEEIAVKAKITSIDGFSAHADQEGLLKWVRCFGDSLKEVILVHGEVEAQHDLGEKIKEITGVEPLVPALEEIFAWSEAGFSREALQLVVPMEPKFEKVTAKPKRKTVTQKQVNQAVLQLRRQIKNLVEKSPREDYDLLLAIQEITDLVDVKLHHVKGR